MIVLNGERSDLSGGETVVRALELLGLEADSRGIAVAVDGEVVPRREWDSFQLAAEARVEVVTAMQGG